MQMHVLTILNTSVTFGLHSVHSDSLFFCNKTGLFFIFWAVIFSLRNVKLPKTFSEGSLVRFIIIVDE